MNERGRFLIFVGVETIGFVAVALGLVYVILR
jgi:hypothetical protein